MNKPDEFEQKAKSLLDDGVEDLHPDIQRKLQQARYAALEKAGSRAGWNYLPQALAATFAIAVVSLSLLFNFNENELSHTELAMESDFEVLMASDGLDLMEELEFMQWLAESDEYAS